VIHLDREHWRPGWVETPRDEWESRVRELAAAERWIIDGNYGGTIKMRLERADTIVFLDFGRVRCLRGAITRRIRYRNQTRPDMSEGCPEQLTWQFLRWIWDYRRTKRPGIQEMLSEARALGKRVVVLRSYSEVTEFLQFGAKSADADEPDPNR
jgi:adenylate kinase family enzyme